MGKQPDWLSALIKQCETQSLSAISKQTGLSKSVISQVTNGKYPGDLLRVQDVIEGVYLSKTVECPVLGNISKDKCLAFQVKPLVTGNPQNIKIYRACRSGCPNSKLERSITATKQMRVPIKNINNITLEQRVDQLKANASNDQHLIKLLIDELTKHYRG